MANQNAEQRARDRIDDKLRASGWEVQDFAAMNVSAAEGVAVREFKMERGFGKADYLLYAARTAVGVVEAKPEGDTLTGVEVQTQKYGEGLPKGVPCFRRPLPFLYQSTGVETRFTNALDPEPTSRDVFSFHRPETFLEALRPSGSANRSVAERRTEYDTGTLLHRLQRLPPVSVEGMRRCQVRAIQNLEASLADNRRRALIQMQTGSGKTYTAVAQTYRLIKHAQAKRVLFLVDRSNLARQTMKEFQQYVTPDDGRKFTELYNVQHLRSNVIAPVCQVVVTTIQRLYSILQGEAEFDESKEEESALGAFARFQHQPLPVVYNPALPIETFDFVFTDECHRSIYNLWRQVLEYFDAYLVGLTATPSKQTLGFFDQNLVMEYGHAQAVADGVNVDFEVYRIKTRIGEEGGSVEAGTVVDKRDRKSRRVRWEELDEDLNYRPNELDRAIVVPDQIRTVVRTFKERLFTEIFPGRTEVPKTLVFAKDDSHAEDIVRIFREEFAKGNEFCQKITYKTSTARVVNPETGDVTYQGTNLTPEVLLNSFRNSYNPRIAVTVDMIATGTDVRPLEIVFFMRDVLSANYFEQMKGRGCRVISPTEFQNVTPDGVNKERYVIVDAVGVTERERNDSIPLERQPGVPLKTVLQAIGAGSTEPEVVGTFASRLSRLDKVVSPGVRSQIEALAGRSMPELIARMVESLEPDAIQEAAQRGALSDPAYPSFEDHPTYEAATARRLREEALAPFLNGELRTVVLLAQQEAEQTIARSEKDEVIFAGASVEATEKAKTTIESFARYLEENRDEITAIQLLYRRRRGLAPTFRQLRELAEAISLPPRAWTPEALWHAYETLERDRVRGRGGRMVTDLVSLVRFALNQETILSPFAETVNDRFEAWLTQQELVGRRFTSEQRTWLQMIRDHIAGSVQMDREAFEYSPFVQEGGLGKAFAVFGDDLDPLVRELNEVLAS
ncbi:MAG: DEAD/DEAH box helicase family protein [Fimbriimonadaceae bacterium]|nr:DEAD/DEAH box helicase family protein [Fimbriimonadaceae bacterium]